MNRLTVTKASGDTVQDLAPSFDSYRQLYGKPSDIEGARKFLAERLTRSESVVFSASEGNHVVGFAQLYPSFSSLSMKRTWILNDLFVSASARGHGVGTALLKECKQLAVETGAAGLALETMKGNFTAQRLYEELGWDAMMYSLGTTAWSK